MTTLAWDGTTLAVDSQATLDGARVDDVVKLHVSNNRAMALAGEAQDTEVVWDWFINMRSDKDRPAICTEQINGIFVIEGTAYDFFDKLRLVELTGTAAYGSGWKWAQAAMDCGMNAEDAVLYASKKDLYTGGKILTWSYSP